MEIKFWVCGKQIENGLSNNLACFIKFQLFCCFFLYILGDAVNAVINENFDVVSKDIIPLVEKALQRLLKRISSKILENFTHEQVFPQ